MATEGRRAVCGELRQLALGGITVPLSMCDTVPSPLLSAASCLKLQRELFDLLRGLGCALLCIAQPLLARRQLGHGGPHRPIRPPVGLRRLGDGPLAWSVLRPFPRSRAAL
ncbi:hypothetical protein NGB36_03655 [Streptomyces sp. RB6PN25]|uniref:Uncharacterized protein n=1 Tax=Streptomyces humicola TaxID=2953240 RepID=A0ABT1PPV1_9ACTN|nr:hypothetical protein [Streptomyces humicola]MCQ4079712.1 hypothetical protein [Streptomyces humicola]